ncbi:MAG: TolC family protein [Methylococcales bacterium]|nr:TolC family protein [Methylococcales bacterium]
MNKITSAVLCLFLVHPGLACAEDLLTVYQQAIDADPTLKSADIKTEIGAAQKGQAFGEMLPQVTASANWSANNQRQSGSTAANTSNYHGTRYTLSLTQSVIDFAKFWNWRTKRKKLKINTTRN